MKGCVCIDVYMWGGVEGVKEDMCLRRAAFTVGIHACWKGKYTWSRNERVLMEITQWKREREKPDGLRDFNMISNREFLHRCSSRTGVQRKWLYLVSTCSIHAFQLLKINRYTYRALQMFSDLSTQFRFFVPSFVNHQIRINKWINKMTLIILRGEKLLDLLCINGFWRFVPLSEQILCISWSIWHFSINPACWLVGGKQIQLVTL